MKKKLAVLFTTLLCATQVQANTINEVLSLYGVDYDAVDVTVYVEELEHKKQQYQDLKTDYTSDQYFYNTQAVANDMSFESIDYYAKLETNQRYLESLVKINADLNLIFEAESEYRNSLNDYLNNSNYRSEFNLENYDISGVSITEINSTVDKIKELQETISVTSELPNIGIFENLRTPTTGHFTVTSKYGYRSAPFTGATAFHNGLDLGAPLGTELVTLFSGKVLKAGDFGDGYGNCVLVSHVNEFQTFYAHLDTVSVKAGDYVNQYDKIGTVGSTGRSTGPHLHLTVYINEKSVDPMFLFEER